MKWKIPTKHHSGKDRCRLRRQEERHELEGRAERECGGAHCGGEARTGATRKLMPVRRPLGKGSDRREAGICARITVGTLHGVDFRNRDEKKERTDSAGVGVDPKQITAGARLGPLSPPRRSGCQPEALGGKTGESLRTGGTGTHGRPGAAGPTKGQKKRTAGGSPRRRERLEASTTWRSATSR